MQIFGEKVFIFVDLWLFSRTGIMWPPCSSYVQKLCAIRVKSTKTFSILFLEIPQTLKTCFTHFGKWQAVSLSNIKFVVADIMHGTANILHGVAVILHSMAGILSNMPDIFYVQHQIFEIFLSVLGFSKGKIHFFPKVLKKWSSCQKNGYHFYQNPKW